MTAAVSSTLSLERHQAAGAPTCHVGGVELTPRDTRNMRPEVADQGAWFDHPHSAMPTRWWNHTASMLIPCRILLAVHHDGDPDEDPQPMVDAVVACAADATVPIGVMHPEEWEPAGRHAHARLIMLTLDAASWLAEHDTRLPRSVPNVVVCAAGEGARRLVGLDVGAQSIYTLPESADLLTRHMIRPPTSADVPAAMREGA